MIRGWVSKAQAGLLVTASALALSVTTAQAADLGGNCCADLEERIAELESTTARKGNRKVSLEVSGQVNEALLFWDDGVESNVYQATNETSRSRFRFKGEAKIGGDWTAGYLLEFGIRANRMSRLDQDTDDAPSPSGTPDLRHSTWFIGSKTYGKAWVGNTSQATDGITELTTANTNHFARNSINKWNADWFLNVDGTRAGSLRWRQVLPQSGFTGDGVPGEGDRFNLVRYDSPTFAGFSFQTAWGEDDFWDVALRYAGEHQGFKLVAGIGYSRWNGDVALGDGDTSVADGVGGRGCAPSVGAGGGNPGLNDSECGNLGLSASIMHIDSGLFVTGSYGIKDDEQRDALFGYNVDNTDEFFHVQAGIERKFIPIGKTTFYGEYARFDTGAGIDGGSSTDGELGIRSISALPGVGTRMSGSEVDYWGFGVNQHLEKAAMDIYLAYRHLDGEVSTTDGLGNSEGTVQLDDVDMVLGGAMIKF